MMATTLINLEHGRPKVESAMMKLRLELATLRRIGVRTVKIIHGYGSTGNGGAIRQTTRQ
jgi:DNA-nicking Smr family endonuclease